MLSWFLHPLYRCNRKHWQRCYSSFTRISLLEQNKIPHSRPCPLLEQHCLHNACLATPDQNERKIQDHHWCCLAFDPTCSLSLHHTPKYTISIYSRIYCPLCFTTSCCDVCGQSVNKGTRHGPPSLLCFTDAHAELLKIWPVRLSLRSGSKSLWSFIYLRLFVSL